MESEFKDTVWKVAFFLRVGDLILEACVFEDIDSN